MMFAASVVQDMPQRLLTSQTCQKTTRELERLPLSGDALQRLLVIPRHPLLRLLIQ